LRKLFLRCCRKGKNFFLYFWYLAKPISTQNFNFCLMKQRLLYSPPFLLYVLTKRLTATFLHLIKTQKVP
jgi:hypothetical protein